MNASRLACVALLALPMLAACGRQDVVPRTPAALLPETGHTVQDTTAKEDLRLVPPEAYMRTYLKLFGGLAPQEVQRRARGNDGNALFDTWDDYLSALGFPDYRMDLPRATQTNALMVSAFERLGNALCDRAMEHDWITTPPVAMPERLIYAFDPPAKVDAAAFAVRFDVLHRTFLSYPARMAPPGRVEQFHDLYDHTVAHHAQRGAPSSRFTPAQAGWTAVCYGLVRHPEFHLY